MSDEGTARPFSPAELEDALEQLQGEDAFVVGALPDGGDALVRERLTSYRAITRLSRDVLQQYAAPSHVLDRVVAIAHETAAEAPAITPSVAPAPRSWWVRMRGAWAFPLVTAAAAIALVVVIVVPTRDADDRAADTVAIRSPTPTSASASRPEPAPAESGAPNGSLDRIAMAAEEPKDGEEQGRLRGVAALDEAEAEKKVASERFGDAEAPRQSERRDATTTTDPSSPDAKPSREPKAPSAQPNKPVPKAAPPADAPAGPARPGGGAAPSTELPDATKRKGDDADKEAETSSKVDGETLARADAARRGGDCAAAEPLYESLRKSGTRKQRARALVGLALCAETSGQSDRATDLLAKARAEDAASDAYFESER